MWRQLSGSEKFWVVLCGLVAAMFFAGALLIRSLHVAVLGVSFACLAVSIVERNRRRGPREPINSPESDSAPTAFTDGAAKLPLAAWLYFGGFAVDMIAGFLPYWTGGAIEKAQSFSRSGGYIVAEVVVGLLIYGGGAMLAWATFARPRTQRGTLIALTVLIGFFVLNVISAWTFARPSSGSPAAGLFLDTAASSFLAVRVVMDWIARSKRNRKPANSISPHG
jgi:hypothetical protein